MLARLHSLLGVLALGAFLVQHLAHLWPALGGAEGWVAAHPQLDNRLGLALVVMVAMLGHAALGVARARERGRGDAEAGAAGELGLVRLQLVTGAIALLFVAYHLVKMWAHVAPGMGPHEAPYDAYATLWRDLGRPHELAIHLVGVTAACFHLGHGLSRVPETWGRARAGDGSRRRLPARLLAGLLAAALWLAYLQVLGHFALGAPLLPSGTDRGAPGVGAVGGR